MGSILLFVTAVRCPLGLGTGVLNIDIERAGADRDRSMTNRGGEVRRMTGLGVFSFFLLLLFVLMRLDWGGMRAINEIRKTFISPFDHRPLSLICYISILNGNKNNPTLSSKFSIDHNPNKPFARLRHPSSRSRSGWFSKFRGFELRGRRNGIPNKGRGKRERKIKLPHPRRPL